jgi:hypothetical protein
MSDTYPYPEVFSHRHFHVQAERLLLGLGSVVAVAGLFGICRPAFAPLENLDTLEAIGHSAAAPAAEHSEDWYLHNVGEGGLLFLEGLGMYAVGNRHKNNRLIDEGFTGMLYLESLRYPNTAPDSETET